MNRFRTINYIKQRLVFADAANGWMEKTWPDLAVRFQHCRYPWRVAAGRAWRSKAEMSAEMLENAMEFRR